MMKIHYTSERQGLPEWFLLEFLAVKEKDEDLFNFVLPQGN